MLLENSFSFASFWCCVCDVGLLFSVLAIRQIDYFF